MESAAGGCCDVFTMKRSEALGIKFASKLKCWAKPQQGSSLAEPRPKSLAACEHVTAPFTAQSAAVCWGQPLLPLPRRHGTVIDLHCLPLGHAAVRCSSHSSRRRPHQNKTSPHKQTWLDVALTGSKQDCEVGWACFLLLPVPRTQQVSNTACRAQTPRRRLTLLARCTINNGA